MAGLGAWEHCRHRVERLRDRLYLDLEAGRVDPDIIPLLSLLWGRGYATTSSCSGRIVVKRGSAPWAKPGVRIVASWHLDPPEPRVVYHAALSAGRFSWVAAEPPMVTLYAPSLEAAEGVVRAAVRAGFKYAGYRGSECGYYVVIRGEERLEAPVVVGGEPVVDYPGFERVWGVLLAVWRRGKERLARLLEALEAL